MNPVWIIIFIFLSFMWCAIGVVIFEKLKLPDPCNVRQHFIACLLLGPIGMLIIYGVGFFNWLEKYYKGGS